MFQFRINFVLFLGATLLFTSCSTCADKMKEPRAAFYDSEYDRSEALLVEILKNEDPADDGSDSHLVQADLAMVKLAQGDPAAAVRYLIAAQEKYDRLEIPLTTEQIAVGLTDDNAEAYAGEPYELLTLRTIAALADLVANGGNTRALIENGIRKENNLEELFSNAEIKGIKESAVDMIRMPANHFVRGMLLEDMDRSGDAASRNYTRASQYSSLQGGTHDGERIASYSGRASSHYTKNVEHGVVWVYGMVGRGPVKVEKKLTMTANVINGAKAALALSGVSSDYLPTGPIPVAEMSSQKNVANGFMVSSGQVGIHADMLTDLNLVAHKQFDLRKDNIYSRTVARRAGKEFLKAAGTTTAEEEGGTVWQHVPDFAGALWTSAECADIRCWSFIPASLKVTRIELPAGTHRIAIQPISGDQAVSGPKDIAVEVKAGQATYVLCYVGWKGALISAMTNAPASMPMP